MAVQIASLPCGTQIPCGTPIAFGRGGFGPDLLVEHITALPFQLGPVGLGAPFGHRSGDVGSQHCAR